MKISKAILQNAKDANEDPNMAMLAYRTTPISPTTPHFMELTHQCKPRCGLPIANAALGAKGIAVKVAKSLKINKIQMRLNWPKDRLSCTKPHEKKSGKKPKS